MKRLENVAAYAVGGILLLGLVVPVACQWHAVESFLSQLIAGKLGIDELLAVLHTNFGSAKGALAGACIGASNGWLKPITQPTP
jgi:hypothetical protein